MRFSILFLLILVRPVAAFAQALPQYFAAEYDIGQLTRDVENFKQTHFRYPSESEITNDVFIGFVRTRDPWGNAYVYRFPGSHNPDSFDLYSLGEDGISKTCGSD